MTTKINNTDLAKALLEKNEGLATAFDELEWTTKKLGWIYNPLDYARDPARQYLETYGLERGRKAIWLGMNPGPWGMAQTAVPFGDVVAARDWMGLSGQVGQPSDPCEKKPVEGYALERREGSGKRLWGWIERRWGTPANFFDECFVWNYCPLMFLEKENARNLTPTNLYKADREALFPICDDMLRALVEQLQPEWLIGVGKFAHGRAKAVAKSLDTPPQVATVLHPSPASPAANAGWIEKAETQLAEQGVTFDNWLDAPPEDLIISR